MVTKAKGVDKIMRGEWTELEEMGAKDYALNIINL